ncbi:MAG: CARDB domain-containing protein [Candidatus Altiarchaeia archaeon]
MDNTPPVITSTTPTTNQKIDNTAYLAVNASDASGIRSADWYLQTTQGPVRIGSGQRTYWGCGGLNGNYTILVNVTDLVGNVATRTVPVEIRSPDLSVEGVSFVPIVPAVNYSNAVKVSIKNKGSLNADNFYARLYVGYNETNNTLIDQILPDQVIEAVLYWTPRTAGPHNITVVVDPVDYVSESNETNNYMTMSIDIPGEK